VSCTIVRRTRRIPQEVLGKMMYGEHLDDKRYTHFVGEVVEGGSATLSFISVLLLGRGGKEDYGRAHG
jgi:hypothetical protein